MGNLYKLFLYSPQRSGLCSKKSEKFATVDNYVPIGAEALYTLWLDILVSSNYFICNPDLKGDGKVVGCDPKLPMPYADEHQGIPNLYWH